MKIKSLQEMKLKNIWNFKIKKNFFFLLYTLFHLTPFSDQSLFFSSKILLKWHQQFHQEILKIKEVVREEEEDEKLLKIISKGTKILCTLGPSSSSEEILIKMIKSGMDSARFNFSHGTHENHKKNFDLIRKISKEKNLNISILCDIQGPKIRVGEMEKEIEIVRKQIIKVTSEKSLVFQISQFLNF